MVIAFLLEAHAQLQACDRHFAMLEAFKCKASSVVSTLTLYETKWALRREVSENPCRLEVGMPRRAKHELSSRIGPRPNS